MITDSGHVPVPMLSLSGHIPHGYIFVNSISWQMHCDWGLKWKIYLKLWRDLPMILNCYDRGLWLSLDGLSGCPMPALIVSMLRSDFSITPQHWSVGNVCEVILSHDVIDLWYGTFIWGYYGLTKSGKFGDTILLSPWAIDHWPLGHVAVILMIYFSSLLYKLIARASAATLLFSECHTTPKFTNEKQHWFWYPEMASAVRQQALINPSQCWLLTQIYVTIWCH